MKCFRWMVFVLLVGSVACSDSATRPDASDRIAPTISFTAPANGATVSGSVRLTASATDNVGVERVRFLNGQTLLGSDAIAPYSIDWVNPPVGDHTIRAEASDTAGNIGSAEITLTVVAAPLANPRPTSIAKEGDGQLTAYADRPPTDSLTLTIIDQYGDPMPGLSVTWAADSEAGSVSAATTTTDSVGRVAVAWTVGSRAGENRVLARVPGLAPIPYLVHLVPSALALSPDSIVMWPFDGQLATFELRDTLGIPLSIGIGLGPAPAWTTDHPAIATIASDGTIQAHAEGETVIRLTFSGLDESIPLTVGTQITGRITPIDDGDRGNVRVFATHADPSVIDSADVEADGFYALRVRKPVSGVPIQLHIDAHDRTQRRYHPSLRTVTYVGDPINAVLVLKRWQLPTGSYTGQVVPISPNAAMGNGLVGDGVGIMNFYRDLAPGAMYSWRESAFPLAVWIDHPESGHPVTAADSITLWTIIDGMEARFGKDLFYPAEAADIPITALSFPDITGAPDTIWVRLNSVRIVIGNNGLITTGGSLPYCYPDNDHSACWPVADRVYGAVFLQVTTDGLGTVDRELMKVLGMGHTCYWNTRMYTDGSEETESCQARFLGTPSGWPPSTPTVSASDVAHWSVFHYVAHISRLAKPKFGIPEAANGERVFELGLPPIVFPTEVP